MAIGMLRFVNGDIKIKSFLLCISRPPISLEETFCIFFNSPYLNSSPRLRYLKSVNILCWWELPFFGGDQPCPGNEFWSGDFFVAPPLVWADVPKNGLYPPIEGRPYAERVVSEFKNLN